MLSRDLVLCENGPGLCIQQAKERSSATQACDGFVNPIDADLPIGVCPTRVPRHKDEAVALVGKR